MTFRWRVRLLVLLAVILAVIAGALSARGIASTHGQRTLSYSVRNAGIAYLTKAGLSTTFPGVLETGDQIFARDFLYDGSTKIGYDNETCTVTFDNNDLCRVVAAFTGKGEIESTWLWMNRNGSLYGPKHFNGIVDGGTGRFAQSHGEFHATTLQDGSLRITARIN